MASMTPSELMDRLSNLQFSDVEKAVQDVIKAISQPNYFATTKRGETHELRADLNSDDHSLRKDTVKRVIAHMTIGKDVSSLFPDVLKNMQTEDLELKKLIYLYLMNYAKTQPELVILAVNTFVKDTDDSNPLIRALAIRTMSCIRVDKMIDFFSEPLSKCLNDNNPYVRKTAAIAVAKLYDLSPSLALENGFVATLQDLVGDANPMVVANAIAALMDIQEAAGSDIQIFKVTTYMLNKLLAALSECSEWGQIVILTALSDYEPSDSREAELVCEKIMPRLQHANGSVVLMAIRCLLLYIHFLDNNDYESQVYNKITPPLVSLMSSVPEVQYVALRNISLILMREPQLLKHDNIKVFYCRYNDPPYIKIEKIDIMMKLVNDENYDQVIDELKEYVANEVDMDFIKKSVSAVGKCALYVSNAAERCVSVLMDLITTSPTPFVVHEAIVAMTDILRRYPGQFDPTIPTLIEHFSAEGGSHNEDTENIEVRAVLIWLLGEYSIRIPNAVSLLETALFSFKEEPVRVQLQLLTATVKIFLRGAEGAEPLVLKTLQTVTSESTNADLRDRAYIYWRLLSTNASLAAQVVLAEKPQISKGEQTPSHIDQLIRELGTVSAVRHRPSRKETPKQSVYEAEDEKETVNELEIVPAAQANVAQLIEF